MRAPPDLTVIARSRAESAAAAARTTSTPTCAAFYRDDSKATGWNNLVFPNVGMPHVLWELQGQQRAVFETDARTRTTRAMTHHVFKGFEPLTPGTLTRCPVRRSGRRPGRLLQWMGEPNQHQRVRLGVLVLLFLACSR